MSKRSITRRMQIWVACLAILFNALAPSVSYAMSALNGSPSLVEICSAAGTRLVSIDVNGKVMQDDGKTSQGKMASHCPFCLTHVDSPGLPPAALPDFHMPAAQAVFPKLFYQAPQPLFSWSVAKSRAPPFPFI